MTQAAGNTLGNVLAASIPRAVPEVGELETIAAKAADHLVRAIGEHLASETQQDPWRLWKPLDGAALPDDRTIKYPRLIIRNLPATAFVAEVPIPLFEPGAFTKAAVDAGVLSAAEARRLGLAVEGGRAFQVCRAAVEKAFERQGVQVIGWKTDSDEGGTERRWSAVLYSPDVTQRMMGELSVPFVPPETELAAGEIAAIRQHRGCPDMDEVALVTHMSGFGLCGQTHELAIEHLHLLDRSIQLFPSVYYASPAYHAPTLRRYIKDCLDDVNDDLIGDEKFMDALAILVQRALAEPGLGLKPSDPVVHHRGQAKVPLIAVPEYRAAVARLAARWSAGDGFEGEP